MNPKRILLVEDNPADARLMVELLANNGSNEIEFHLVDRISVALTRQKEQIFDIILLDLTLPDSSGLDTVERMCAASLQVPVIVLTGLEDDALALAAVHTGAQDYLIKGQVDGPAMSRSIRYAIERKRLEENLLYLATHDSLTNLPNRRLFQDRMALAIERARRNRKDKKENWKLAVMMLDLDNFKTINDTLGHSQGDHLLQVVAGRLQSSIRKSDTLARMGGDEFPMIFENITGREEVENLARKIHSVFSQPFHLGDHILEITVSIGISLYPSDGDDTETLLRQADIAMYQAKEVRNTYRFFEMSKEDL
jgi:diguanylate cyclase (GGDEF)-like protein